MVTTIQAEEILEGIEVEGDTMITETMKPNASVVLKHGLFSRLFGKCETKPPADTSCWSYNEGTLTLDLARVPELKENATGIRLEGAALPLQVLVMRGDDGRLRAYHNSCGHGGRRLDPVPGAATLQCCSIGHATYNYEGKRLTEGPTRDVTMFETSLDDSILTVTIPQDVIDAVRAGKKK